MPKTICIDIDGTIVHYTEWIDSEHFGDIIKGAPEATHKLHDEGWYIIIYTTRADNEATKDFLKAHNFYYDALNENPNQPNNAIGGKPIADIYVDDRAICFNGNWEKTLKEISNFKPWEKRIANETHDAEVAKNLLITDFQQALYLHRHYDEMNLKLTNFAFGQVLVCFGACWTLQFAMQTNPDNTFLNEWVPWWIFSILLLSTAFSLMSILLICKNRSYFVRICRYINEFREYAINNNDIGFVNTSGMWHNSKYPNVKDWKSTQLTCYILIALCYLIEAFATGYSYNEAAKYNYKGICAILISVGFIILGTYVSCISLKEIKNDQH